jgi:hypothetical protein
MTDPSRAGPCLPAVGLAKVGVHAEERRGLAMTNKGEFIGSGLQAEGFPCFSFGRLGLNPWFRGDRPV